MGGFWPAHRLWISSPVTAPTESLGNRPPPQLGHIKFHRPFHKEVGYQRRKNLGNCDTVAPLRSIDRGCAGEESVRALLVSPRSQLLWLEVGHDSSPRPRNRFLVRRLR